MFRVHPWGRCQVQGEKWEELWGGCLLQLPFTHRSEVFQYFCSWILVPVGTRLTISPVWKYVLYASKMDTFTNDWITYGKLISRAFHLKPYFFNSNYSWDFFLHVKSVLLKVNLATSVKRYISKRNFQKNALDTLTKLILSHLAEVLGCLASARSGKPNRFPEQHVARKPSKLIYLVLWGDIEHPPVIGTKGNGGKGGGGRDESW